MRIVLLSLLLSFAPLPLAAQDEAPAVPPQTRIEADAEAGQIRFVVEGETVAVLDAGGLSVRGDISYGGMMTDYGKAEFERRTAREDGGQGDAQ